MWVLSDKECQKLLKTVKALDRWCKGELRRDPAHVSLDVLAYATGLQEGMEKILRKMGVPLK